MILKIVLALLPSFGFILARFPDSSLCPSLDEKIWQGYVPKANKEAGKYTNAATYISLASCVGLCCEEPNCNVVFMFNTTCYKIECYNDEKCKPVIRPDLKFGNNVKMVLVRPVGSYSWRDNGTPDDNDEMLMISSDNDQVRSCIVGETDGCDINEICVSSTVALANICECKPGFTRKSSNLCSSIKMRNSSEPTMLSSVTEIKKNEPLKEALTSSPTKTKILVTVVSKDLRLPENEVQLSAFTVPAEVPGKTRYNYKWELLSKPEGSEGSVSEGHGGTLKLSHLTEGLYRFKVSVSSLEGYGETEANVSVLPQKRENEPPIAIVLPPHQIVKLPNSMAVLDATSSRDDSEIVKYHWELQQGPLGYQPNLSDKPTLQLKDLHKPGNYSFRLTVTDSDSASNSTFANITVLQVPDYPPEANAGPSIILYLPRNNVTLNGNMSSDDKGIVSWEWTKGPSDQNKAVDMQNTRTPFLQLSHLEEGMYTFVLKVTDNSGQSSSSDVHVFVKPATNKPPVATAGANQTIALPQTWALLNGSLSNDDIGIDDWKWEQLSGPRKAIFSTSNSSTTNVTDLTKGEYVFQLTVTDSDSNSVSDKTTVTVTQNKNVPPKANGGGDQVYNLPLAVLIVNGTLSQDDLGIAKWQWTREPTSLAMGNIIDNSDTSPILMVTNVVAGRYEFRLRVTDDQGEWSEDTVSIILKSDLQQLNLVELTLNIEAGQLTQNQRDSVLVKLSMLLRDASQLVVRELQSDSSGRAKFVFYVSRPSGAVPGPEVVHTLKNKLAQDSFLLQISVIDIRTSICQNNCSGHGVCDQYSRVCFCEAFWMQDLVRKYLGDGESNCAWSILYVIISLGCLLIMTAGIIWAVICLCSRLCQRSDNASKDKTRYALLEIPLGKVIHSDSESDSDVIYENRLPKTNGVKGPRNGYKNERRPKV